jgi:hypothetical protein
MQKYSLLGQTPELQAAPVGRVLLWIKMMISPAPGMMVLLIYS